ncbi:hypothetical protein KR018_009985 [Drosophila ironensis]|nr:hypothetical protein KR018_009985 [Drosophila ironensis]
MFFCKSLVNNFYKYKRKVCHNGHALAKRFNASHNPPRVLFFGTDHFSLPSLQALHRNCSDRLGVVTSFKSPANCVRSYAEQQGLPLQRWPLDPVQCSGYDVGVVVSFGHLIPAQIIHAFPSGMINVHASLLPRWRGAAPVIYAIMKGDTRTGVSIMKIEPHRFDVGAVSRLSRSSRCGKTDAITLQILAQREVPVKPDAYMPELHASLASLGAHLLVETVNNLSERLENAKPQDNAAASYAPKITSQLTEVSWGELTAEEVHARHRALFGYKNLTTSFSEKQVQLLDLRLPEALLPAQEPGRLSYQRKRKSLLIGCARESQIEVLQLRVEGRRPMSAQDFSNGFLKQARALHFLGNKLRAC